MMNIEREALDKWADKEKVEVSHWTNKDGQVQYEARTWKDGRPVRRLSHDKHIALQNLQFALQVPSVHDKPAAVTLCAHCTQPAAHTFRVQVDAGVASQAGLQATGAYVPGGYMGSTVEEVPLCVGCIVGAFEGCALAHWNDDTWANWVRVMRIKKR